MKTTEIEKQLKKKCKEELSDIVKKFSEDIIDLENKYGGKTFLEIKPLKEKSLIFLSIPQFSRILQNSLQEKFEDDMLERKTKILLEKINLF